MSQLNKIKTSIPRLFAKKRIVIKPRKFYRPPVVRQKWKEEQEELENTWGELFFDLIYVAIAFRLGDLIVADFELGEYGRAVLFSYSIFLLTYDAWNDRANFLARFKTEDTFHKALDIFSGMVCATMALNIVTVEEFIDVGNGAITFNYAFILTVAKLVLVFVDLFKYIEFRHFSNHEEQGITWDRHVSPATRTALLNAFVSIVLLCVALYTSYEDKIVVTAYVWLASSIIPKQLLNFVRYYYRMVIAIKRVAKHEQEEKKQVGVPLNVQFYVDRSAEFLMLLNGEGVLQVIILPIALDHVKTHLGSFLLCILILSFIQYIQYELMPTRADDHAFRKSGRRAVYIIFLWPICLLSVIFVGVGLKLVLKSHYKLDYKTGEYYKYAFLLCISLSLVFFILVVVEIVHTGPYELVFDNFLLKKKNEHNKDFEKNISQCGEQCGDKNNVAYGRIIAYASLMITSLSFLILPGLHLNGIELLGAIVAILFIFTLQVHLYKRQFTSSDQEEVETKVLTDKKKYNKEEINTMLDVWRDRTDDLINAFNSTDPGKCQVMKANDIYKETEKLQDMLDAIQENIKGLIPVADNVEEQYEQEQAQQQREDEEEIDRNGAIAIAVDDADGEDFTNMAV